MVKLNAQERKIVRYYSVGRNGCQHSFGRLFDPVLLRLSLAFANPGDGQPACGEEYFVALTQHNESLWFHPENREP